MRPGLLALHRWLGLAAGLVLSVVGITGGMLAFEPQLMRVINPEVLVLSPVPGKLLSADALLTAARRQLPGRPLQSLVVSMDRTMPAQIVEALPGKPRGKMHRLHPVTGRLLPLPRGDGVFHFVEDVHRKLLAGDVGKVITGVSSGMLLFLTLSGLWLRLRTRPSLRRWLLVTPGLRGRGRLWQWHAVAGSWAALLLMFSAVTGLWWSWTPWKQGLQQLLSAEAPAPLPTSVTFPAITPEALAHLLQPHQAWLLGLDHVLLSIDLRAAVDGKLLLEALPRDARHERARDLVEITADSDVPVVRPYEEKPWGVQAVSAWKLVHTGRLWGWPAQLALMLSSLAMPVLLWLGWRLHRTRPR